MVNDSLWHVFIQSQIQEINEQLYQGALDGKVDAYTNDSFASTYTLSELAVRGGYENHPNDPEPEKTVSFDPKTGFTGLALAFGIDQNMKSRSTSMILMAVGPTFMQTVMQIELGQAQLFWIKQSQLSLVLSPQRIQLLHSMIMQTSLVGDFSPWSAKHYNASDVNSVAEAMVSRTLYSAPVYTRISDSVPRLLAKYNKILPSKIISVINAHQVDDIDPQKVLFKDSKLTTPFEHLGSELGYEFVVELPDPNAFGSYFDSTLLVFEELFGDYDFIVTRKHDDFLFDMHIVNSFDDLRHIYLSFNSIKVLYSEQDLILMDAFLQKMVN